MAGSDAAAPLIIVGTGRCGSTLLHRTLALHDELGWLSPYNEVLPTQPWLSALSGLYRLPLPRRVKHWRAFPKPFEAYRFWEHYLPGFSRRDRPLTADDVPPDGIAPVRSTLARALRFQRRGRLLVKVTGWSRIAYFDRIFPGARFVFLQRDPRAVVSSWVQAGWLDVTSPPRSAEWQWGDVPDPYYEAWREFGADALLSVALKIRLDLDDIARNRALFPERCHELSYEELITSPEPALRSILSFAGIGWTPAFGRALSRLHFYDSRDTWRKHLTEAQADRVLEFLDGLEGLSTAPKRT